MNDPEAIIAGVQRQLLMQDWNVTWAWCPAGKLPIEGAFAVCHTTPTRSLAHLQLANPWPANEDMPETIRHELVHALISPLTELIEGSAAAVMIEETIVEKLGIALGRSSGPGLARIVANVVDRYAPRMRARISALASRRTGKGRQMDIKLILAAIRAALTADDPKPGLEALMSELDGMQGDPDGVDPKSPPAREGEGDPAKPIEKPLSDARGYARDEEQPMARGRRALDAETVRARKGADLAVATGIRGRLREVRAEGLTLDAKLEAELAAMRDPDNFEQRIADILRGRELAAPGQQRARSGVQVDGAPGPTGDNQPPMTAAQLAAEGFDPAFVAGYQAEHKVDPHQAAATLSGGRNARARKAAEETAMRARAARDVGRGN